MTLPPVLISDSVICTTVKIPKLYRFTHIEVQAELQKFSPVNEEWINP